MQKWIFFAFFLLTNYSKACMCPDLEVLSLEHCGGYEVIFQGEVMKVLDCPEGKVLFKVKTLFKGNAIPQQNVLFSCGSGCSMDFQAGEEWLLFLKKNNAQDLLVNFCGHSRKKYPENQLDPHTELSGRDYASELMFLHENFSPKSIQAGKQELEMKRYEKVEPSNIPVLLGVSMAFMVVGFFVMRKVFK